MSLVSSRLQTDHPRPPQGKTKVEVSESSCTPLILSDTTSPDLPLARCVTEGVEYSPHLFKADCSQRNTYLFHSQEGARSFTVSFSQFGPRILPAATSFNSDVTSPIYTFIHFAPGDLVISPSHPLGSRAWWRLQECQQVHAGFPGEGHWTCRYDGEGQEKRRPVRVISHFASCPSSKGNEFGGEASWSLGRLAKAILDVLPA